MSNDTIQSGPSVSTRDRPTVAYPQKKRDEAAAQAALAKPEQELLKTIGPYRLVQRLGEGGLGEVYLAEQCEPIQRKVAIKLIKADMNSPGVAARFESEIRAIALLDHPNITKPLDAGVTDDGRPYCVMEYVPGIPITDYCDRNRLPIAERLRIFIEVCHAIHHAHQKAIIHRDIKASNVLVAVQDGRAVPKVIDFGIVKAVRAPAAGMQKPGTSSATAAPAASTAPQPQLTLHGQLMGTPEYMSPEQAEMTALPVDTRTDIYSLGTLLYELLVGVLPFDPEILRQSGHAAIPRMIRETEIPPMWQRLDQLGDRAQDMAHRRKTKLPALRRDLRGELQWIVTQAMDKDPTRRYASASELAADVRRYLKHEPVTAAPSSVRYRVRKFVRRHRPVVIAVAVAVVAVLVSLGEVTEGWLHQRRARLQAQADVMRANAVLDHLLRTVESMDPPADGQTHSAQQVLDAASANVGGIFAGQPDAEATARSTLGQLYLAMGRHDSAERHLRRALALRQAAFGPEEAPTVESMRYLASLLLVQQKLDEAELLLTRAVDVSQKRLGPQHPQSVYAKYDLSRLRAMQGQFSQSVQLCRDALAAMEKAEMRDAWSEAMIRRALGEGLVKLAALDEAEIQLLTSLADFKTLAGERHPQVKRGSKILADFYRQSDQPEKAAQFDVP